MKIILTKELQKAAWSRQWSQHIEMRRVKAEEASTGEWSLQTWRNHIERVERRVMPMPFVRRGLTDKEDE